MPNLTEATKHYSKLMRYVRARFHVGDEANDIVQEAYARLIQAAERTAIRDTARFLHSAAINHVKDRQRQFTVRSITTGDSEGQEIASLDPSAERAIIARQQLQIVEQALSELSIKRRAALVLYRFDNLSHSEIAERLGISVSMVEKHVRLGLAHCRMRLEEAERGR